MLVADTTPYPWPYDARFEPSRCALVVCGSGDTWSARCPIDPAVEENIEQLRTAAAASGAAVILVRHSPMLHRGPGAVTPALADPSNSLLQRDGEHVVDAAGIDGFYGSRLDVLLRSLGRDQLLFVGRGFEAPVHSTVCRANDRGYEALTVADACACLDPSLRAASISTIEMSGGIFGAVGTTGAVLSTFAHFPTEASP